MHFDEKLVVVSLKDLLDSKYSAHCSHHTTWRVWLKIISAITSLCVLHIALCRGSKELGLGVLGHKVHFDANTVTTALMDLRHLGKPRLFHFHHILSLFLDSTSFG